MTQPGGALAWWIWVLAVTFVVYTFSFQTGYSIVNSGVQKDLGLSVAQVATTAAIYSWAFALCQSFGGALLDRLGSRKVLPPSIALVSAGVFVFANANSYKSVLGDMATVGRVGHAWIASIIGATSFGVMLALGVVWMRKLLVVHGLDESTAGLVSSLLWFGSAAGNAVFPSWSSYIKSRKVPLIVGGGAMLTCLLALLYVPTIGTPLAAVLCFVLGFSSASHMLTFSTVVDVMKPMKETYPKSRA